MLPGLIFHNSHELEEVAAGFLMQARAYLLKKSFAIAGTRNWNFGYSFTPQTMISNSINEKKKLPFNTVHAQKITAS